MQSEFKQIREFIDEMKNTSSSNAKKEIIKKYDSDFFRKLFEYTYSPFKKYYITSANLIKHPELCSTETYSNLFDLLDVLDNRQVTGHAAIGLVNSFINNYKEFSDIIYDVIDRNIKTRATATLINSVLPNTIPIFSVALAEKYKGNESKVNLEKSNWYVSRKLDGVRCICIIDDIGNVSFYSREGNEFLTLTILENEIKKLSLRNTVFDGELCIVDETGLEDFQGIIKQINKKNHTILNPVYYIFDMIELSDFNNQISKSTLSERFDALNNVFSEDVNSPNLRLLKQQKLKSIDEISKLMEEAENLGYEGLMLRNDTIYEGKRSKNLLKVKNMQDAEYVVLSITSDINRIVQDGAEVEELMLKSVEIEHKGNRVDVGSGFSLEEKRYYHKNPNEIIGNTITVQYFEETIDQFGKYSLRFPVFKINHGKKRII